MAKMQIADGVISSSADYSLFHGTTKVADVRQDEILRMYNARLNSLEADIEYAKRMIYNK